MIKVLVVDDSSFMRVRIKALLEPYSKIKVIGIARNGADAIEKTLALKPDVITMDINMPDMSGIDAVEQIMKTCPTPIIMISSLTSDGTKETIEALEKGAVDYINKSHLDDESLITKIGMAAQAVVNQSTHQLTTYSSPVLSKAFSIIGIGISTGGPKALSRMIPELSPNISASIVIAQHMPPVFTKSLAERLDAESKIRVKEAEDQETLVPGWVYICPGGMHMKINPRGIISLHSKEEYPQYHYSPSADILMSSIAKVYGAKALCIIMTGMGSDGLEGIMEAKNQGSYIMAQSEDSCTIYGMPKAIISNKLHDEIFHLNDISKRINQLCTGD
jgi:two-component system chemotaxis response regulator CheB